MGAENTKCKIQNVHFPCKIIKTITKSCNYQSNCKSTQNALDTEPWKGWVVKTETWQQKKRVNISGVIAGGVTLF